MRTDVSHLPPEGKDKRFYFSPESGRFTSATNDSIKQGHRVSNFGVVLTRLYYSTPVTSIVLHLPCKIYFTYIHREKVRHVISHYSNCKQLEHSWRERHSFPLSYF